MRELRKCTEMCIPPLIGAVRHTHLLIYGSSDAHVSAAARKAQLARLALLASRLEVSK